MAITPEDRDRMRLHFNGSWRDQDPVQVWDQAHKAFGHRFATTVTLDEFKKLCSMFGNDLNDIGGGGDRPHSYRLSIS